MCAKFLSDQLMKSMKFRPGRAGKEGSPDSIADGTVSAGERPDELEHILKKEEEKTRVTVRHRDVAETRRRRDEVLNLLDTTIQDLHREREFFHSKLALFSQLAENLREHPEEFDTSELLDVKRKVRSANIEVAKFIRERAMPSRDGMKNTPGPPLSLLELTLLGLAVTWPILVVIVASVIALVLVLYSLFSV